MKKLLIAFIILLLAAPTFAGTWELAIAKQDEDGTRKKLGDVIAYKPYPHAWGGMELKHYLIVVVDGITETEAYRMTMPLYEFPDGRVIADGWLDFGEMLGKRRYNIDTVKLQNLVGKTAEIDWKLCFDPESTYQPFLDGKTVLNFKTDQTIYDKYNETSVFYGTAPLMEVAPKWKN